MEGREFMLTGQFTTNLSNHLRTQHNDVYREYMRSMDPDSFE